MTTFSESAHEAAAFIASSTGVASHDVALVLGSGWGGAADQLGTETASFPASDVPGFHKPAVEGHSALIRSIALPSGKHALVLGARQHFYESRDARRVAHAVRTAAAAGCSTLILTNGCGSTNPDIGPGTPVLLSDHINFTNATPLEGASFVDMSEVYSSRLRGIAKIIDPTLTEGVYIQFTGPQYETPAEVRMAKLWGADLVGMSTALEAIAAREAGMEILGVSLVTNLAAGLSAGDLNHQEVLQAGRDAGPRISTLLAEIVKAI